MESTDKTPLSPPPLDMSSFYAWLLESVKRQGFTVLLLAVAVWYFWQRDEARDHKLEACRDGYNTVLLRLAERSTIALEQNTQAVIENTEVLETLQEHLNLKKAKKKPIIISPKGGINGFPDDDTSQ